MNATGPRFTVEGCGALFCVAAPLGAALIVAALALFGCGTEEPPSNPVADCDRPDTDCCDQHDQCRRYFGAVAPFCGPDGVCGECADDTDCPAPLVCVELEGSLMGCVQ